MDSFARQSGIPIRYVFEGRQGKSFALNSAVPVSRGKILAFTDDDITLRHDWPQTTLGTIRSRELDGVGGKVLPRWEDEPPRWLRERSHLLVWLAMLDNDERRLLDYPITNQSRLNHAATDACLDGAWSTLRGRYGPPTKALPMLRALRHVVSSHPYLCIWLLTGQFQRILRALASRL